MGMRGPCLRRSRLGARAAGGQLSELLPLGLRSSKRPRAFSAARVPQRVPSWAATAEEQQAVIPSPAVSGPSWTRWPSTRPRPWSVTPAPLLANSAEQPGQGHLPLRGASSLATRSGQWSATAAAPRASATKQPCRGHLPRRGPSPRRDRCADASRTVRQRLPNKRGKRQLQGALGDASVGSWCIALLPSARAQTLSQRLAGLT